MTRPIRLQLKRTQGFNLQELSRRVNGLEAVVIRRPTLFSNPFPIGKPSGYQFKDGGDPTPLIAALTREQAVEFYREMATGLIRPEMHPWGHDWQQHLHEKIGGAYPFGWIKSRLRGKNLACTCAPDEVCHGDFLLEWANQ